MVDIWIPVVSAFIGSIITLGGVLATLHYNQKMQKDERDFRSKQEVFNHALEAIVNFIDYFITLPDCDVSTGSPSQARELALALNGLQLYCDIKTARTLAGLSETFDKVTSEVLKKKLGALFLKEEMNVLDQQIDDHQHSIDCIQAEHVALLASSPTSPQIAEYISQKADLLGKKAECYDKKVKLTKKYYLATEECRDMVSESLRDVYQALRDFLMVAREELGFQIDQKEYAQMMDSCVDTSEKLRKELFEYIRSEVMKKIA